MVREDLHGLGGVDPQQGRQELHQGRRQGRAEGDEQDGRQHRRQLHRRADLRSDRPRPRTGRRVLHRHRQPARRHRPRRGRRRGGRPPQGGPSAAARPSGPTASSSSAASTSGVARARCTCSTRRRCSSCSTPPEPGRYDIFKQYTALVDEQSAKAGDAARAVRASSIGDRPAIPIDEVEPVSEIVKRFSTGAMSYGSISRRGPRDAGDRDELDRRQEQHR